MNLSSLNRCKLILWALFISVIFLLILAESTFAQEKSLSGLSKGQEQIKDEQILGSLEEQESLKQAQLEKERLEQAPLEEVGKLAPQEAELKLEAKEAEVEAKPKTEEEVESKRLLEEVTPEKRVAPQTVSLDFSDVPLNQILATVAQGTDINIVGGEALSQKVSVHLKDTPLKDAFDIILKSIGYTCAKEGNVYRVVPQPETPMITEVFELQFVSARQIRGVMGHLLTEKGQAKAFTQFSEEKYSNTLVVTDTAETMAKVRELIKKLDKKVGQVMIEVKFCEVTLSKNYKLGIDYVIQASLTGASGPTTFPLGKYGQQLLQPPATLTASSGSITTGTISFANFKATLQALDTNSKTKLIANPHVATRSGEVAEIVIGEKIPIPTYERNKETGTMEVTGYEIQDVGVLLRVTPTINNDNTVTLNVHPEVSEITGHTGPNDERPIVSTREITTVFTVESGKTIVIGGLTKEDLSNTLTQVPILGRIPLLGKIFRFKNDSDERTELLIFITPHIL